MANEQMTFQVDNAQLIFRNFSGRETDFNREGDRNFAVILDEENAKAMLRDGWNVKYLASREDGDADTPYISVSVSFKNRPPRVVMVSSAGKTDLTKDSVGVLDWADIRQADLICNAYAWEVGGKSGIKAYLKTLVVTIEEDELERRYKLNESAQQTHGPDED